MPVSKAAAFPAAVLSLRLPLQSIAKSAFYITLHRSPHRIHATSRTISTAFALFQIHWRPIFAPIASFNAGRLYTESCPFYILTFWVHTGSGTATVVGSLPEL